jgi:hypothetical protein
VLKTSSFKLILAQIRALRMQLAFKASPFLYLCKGDATKIGEKGVFCELFYIKYGPKMDFTSKPGPKSTISSIFREIGKFNKS